MRLTNLKKLLFAAMLFAAVPVYAQNTKELFGTTGSDACLIVNVANQGTASVQVLGTWVGTITWYISNDGKTVLPIDLATADAPATPVNTTTGNGGWSGAVAGWKYFHICMTSYTSGRATVLVSAVASGGGGSGGGGGTSATITSLEDGFGENVGDDANDAIRVNVVAGSAAGTVYDVGEAVTPATANATLIGGRASASALSTVGIVDDDFQSLWLTAGGALNVADGGSTLSIDDGGGTITVDGTVTVTDGAGALNVIIDSAPTLTVQATDLDVRSGGGDLALESGGNLATLLSELQSLTQAEDAVHGSGNLGIQMLAVRQDAQSGLAADGDYIPPTIDAVGGLRVSIVAGAGSGGTALADDADFTDGTTSGTPIGGVAESAAPSTVTEGDFGWAAITLNRALKVSIFATDGTALIPAVDVTEDVAETAGGTGPMVMSIRRDVAASSANTSGDNSTFNTDSVGRLWTSGANAEDVASGNADQGLVIFAIRDDTLDIRSQTEGDFEYLHTNANGALWVIDVNSAASLTAVQLIDDPVFQDDTAYTTGTSKGFAVGGVADEAAAAAADPVNANDFAALRLSLDRVLYTRNIDPCSGVAKNYYVVNLSASGTVEIANAVASQFWYICEVNLVTAAANNVLIAHDDTDGCGSITAGMNGGTTAGTGWNFAANGGIALGNGNSTVMKSATANHYFCLATSAATQLSGTIAYVSAP